MWEQGISKPDAILLRIQGNARPTMEGCPADHAGIAHGQPMALSFHLCARFPCGLPQNGPLAGLVYQENTSMVETEPIADQINSSAEQFIHIKDRGDRPSYLGTGLQLDSPALEGIVGLLQGVGTLPDLLLQRIPLTRKRSRQTATLGQTNGEARQ